MTLKWKDIFCCWSKVMTGQACCIYNVVFCPFVLCIWACSIYCCGCIRVYLNRGFYQFCCCCCRFKCCDWIWLYTDKAFPPHSASLGDPRGDSAGGQGRQFSGRVVWERASTFPVPRDTQGRKRHMQLWSREIDSRDICQGALGNCWLLAAIACLAEHEGAIQAVFRTKEVHPRGKYVLRLYDGQKEQWEVITIDDFIPCKAGSKTPFFSQPKTNELYVMLLEKAFAKFCGGYSALEGGQTIWAIRAMTGDPARKFEKSIGGWIRMDLKNINDPVDKRKCYYYPTEEIIDNNFMFEIMREYHRLGSILSASGASGRNGLVAGHAYSILKVRKVNGGFMTSEDFKMIQIRNPWGRGEWSGNWSDKSPLWDQHPAVKKSLEHEDKDDGIFWMSWDDFIANWSQIGVVDRTVDVETMGLHVKDDTDLAPIWACCKGCGYFWCLCQGCKKVYCPHRSSYKTVEVDKRCCDIVCSACQRFCGLSS